MNPEHPKAIIYDSLAAEYVRDSAAFFDSVKLWVHPDHKEKFAMHLNRLSLVADYLAATGAA